MKFRITHVLLATVVVALFAYGLSFPDYFIARWFRFGAWVAAVLLIVRAVSRQAERKAIACGLIAAASYLAVLEYHQDSAPFPTSAVLLRSFPRHVPTRNTSASPGFFSGGLTRNPNADEFRKIGEYGFATIFGLIAAGLAAYWSGEPTISKEEEQ